MKLEVKHITPYLPFKLKCYEPRFNEKHTILGLIKNEIYIGDEDSINSFVLDDETFPILRPLSDLTKEIERNGERFVPIDRMELYGYYDKSCLHTNKVKSISYNMMQFLLEWHFDIFGLIEKGLAIDINTLQNGTD